MIGAALAYAREFGWRVFPCAPNTKTPLRGSHGFHDATADPAAIERLWRRLPRANVALATGAASGVVAIDFDLYRAPDSRFELEGEVGELPPAPVQLTPRGGEHWLFEHPGGYVAPGEDRAGIGADVKGDGGYIMLAPSRFSGGSYTWDVSPAEVAPPPLPERLKERLAARSANGHARAADAAVWVGIARGAVPIGQRNDALCRLAGHLLAKNVDARLVRELALLVGERFRSTHPERLPHDSEVIKVVDSIARRELARRGETP